MTTAVACPVEPPLGFVAAVVGACLDRAAPAVLEAGQVDPIVSLRALTRRFQAATGTAARLRVQGRWRPVAAAAHAVLVEVAGEVLLNVQRHGRALTVSLLLVYEPGAVTLVVRDDGAGLAHRDVFRHAPGRRGLPALRAAVAADGGALALHDARPRGLLVEARVPTDHCLPVSPGGER